MELSEDRHPQFEIIFGGKHEHRESEKVDAEEFIAKKGLQAKGKKVSQMDVKAVRFIEPLQKEEDNVPVPESEAENQAGDIIDDFVEPIDDDPQLSLF